MDVNKKRLVIVFSGFNQRAVISFLRTMETKKINYVIIATSKNDDIFLTKYKEKVAVIRKYTSLVLDDLLLSIKKIKAEKKENEFIIAPTTEALNRFLLENRKKFEELGCIIPLVKKELYELISDKYSFGELCKKNEILVPEEVKLSGEIVFPIVAKPKKYFSIDKGESLFPIIIKNYMDYEMFYKKCNVEDFYYQKYIRGRSFYLLYYYNRNGEIYKFSQENLVQQPNGKSILAAISSDIHNSEESYKYEVMFKKLDYYGFAMIEIKQNKGKNYMIEANPRFWGPSQLFVDAGINFFEVFLNDYGIIESIPKFENIKDSTRYFWFGGLINTIKNNMNLTYYNISENSFLNYIHIWLKNDIYKRDDTIEIFRKEFLNG